MFQEMQADASDHVTRDDLELEIAGVVSGPGDPRHGIFGPGSMTWRINRESALFLGAGRAALLQLAHPWVATALEQHSSLLADPIARFHNTFRVVFTMVFGSTGQAVAASRSLHHLHTRIEGEIPATLGVYQKGSHYEANFIPALLWVYATLVESAVLAYETVLPPLSEAERNAYFAESKTLAALFGIPRTALPSDWAALTDYAEAMCGSDALGVDDRARSMAHALLAGSGSWVRPPRWYRALTAQWMPERLREGFALKLATEDQRSAARARKWLPGAYRRLPAALRYVGPYHEAESRLAQRKPGPWTRTSNHFWIGQAHLPFGDLR